MEMKIQKWDPGYNGQSLANKCECKDVGWR